MDTDTIIRIRIGNACCYSISQFNSIQFTGGRRGVPCTKQKDDNNVIMVILHGEESIKKLMKLFPRNMFYITITG